MNTPRSLVCVLALSVSVAACGKGESGQPAAGEDTDNGQGSAAPAPASAASAAPGPAPGFDYAGTADNLEAYFAALQAAIRSGDVTRAAALTRAVVPTEASLAKALRDDAPPGLAKVVLAQFDKMPTDDAAVARLFGTKPERTEIAVHGATTEQIIAYERGTPAGDEFPGGARDLARAALRPGVTFYEIELVEPGQSLGMKYHLFFFDGSRWVTLGPAWRALNR